MEIRGLGAIQTPVIVTRRRAETAGAPADVVETSSHAPSVLSAASLSIASRITASTSLALFGPRQPTAEEKLHQENLLILERLQAQGVHLSRRRRFRIPLIMKKFVDVTPEKALKYIEKGKDNIRVQHAGNPAISIRNVDDLAVLSVLHHVGATVQPAHPGLVNALAALGASGSFKAYDGEVKPDEYSYPQMSEIGQFGAYHALTGDVRFGELRVRAGGSEVEPGDPEAMVAFTYFKASGSSRDLAHPELGSALMNLKSANVRFTQGHSSVEPMEAYLKLGKSDNPTIGLGNEQGSLMEVDRKRLETDVNLVQAYQERVQAYDRLKAACKEGGLAREALLALEKPVTGSDSAERERVMTALLSMPGDRLAKATPSYNELAGSGRPLPQALSELQACAALYTEPTLAKAMASWRHVRKLDEQGPKGMPFADKLQRYQGLLQGMQDHDAATKTFALIYGDDNAAEYERRETCFGRVVQIQGARGQEPRSAPGVFEAIQKTVRPGEDLDKVIDLFDELAKSQKATDRRNDPVVSAFTHIRQHVIAGKPADLSEDDRVRKFIALLDRVQGNLSVAGSVWNALAADDAAGMILREQLLDRIAQAHNGDLGAAAQDLTQLAQATAKDGGLTGSAAARFLNLLDYCGSFSQALDARKRIDGAPLPAEVTSREVIYCEVAKALRDVSFREDRWERNNARADAIMDNYWFVVRNLQSQDEDPTAVARGYAPFLAAARGNAPEARRTYAMARLHLPDGGSFSLDAKTRHGWLARSLQAAGDADGAWRLMTLAEGAASAQAGEERLATLEALIPVATKLGSEHAFEDSTTALERLVALSTGARTTVPDAARALAATVEKASGDHRGKRWPLLTETFLKHDRGLDEAVADMREFTSLVKDRSDCWAAMTAWPTVVQGPAGLGLADRKAAMGTLLDRFRDAEATVAAYAAATTDAPDAAGLKRNVDDLVAIGSGKAIETYQAIASHVSATSGAPGSEDPAARRTRFAKMAGQGLGTADLEKAWKVTRVPVGLESDAVREEALQTLLESAGHGKLDDALSSYSVLAGGLYPGDSLGVTADAFIHLSQAVRGAGTARKMVAEIQARRLQGEFAGRTLDQLITAFIEAYAVSGNADRAWEVMRQRQADAASVKHEEGGVNIGGIRVPRKSGEE